MNSTKQYMNSAKQCVNSEPMWSYCSREKKKKKKTQTWGNAQSKRYQWRIKVQEFHAFPKEAIFPKR